MKDMLHTDNCIFLCLLGAFFLLEAAVVKGETVDAYTLPRQIQYSFTIRNKSGRVARDAMLWTVAPVKRTATQYCEKITASHPYTLTVDELGNQILCFRFDTVAPYAAKVVSIQADLKIAEKPVPQNLEYVEIFLQPAEYVESDHPDIQAQAAKLKAASVPETARKIYDWVANNLKYAGFLSREQGALVALKNRRGDCTEYMVLFAALCRANRIPARCVGGWICTGNAILAPAGYHNWAEFHHQGRWRLADPQKKCFETAPQAYIAMKIFGQGGEDAAYSFHRFRIVGEGLVASMNGH